MEDQTSQTNHTAEAVTGAETVTGDTQVVPPLGEIRDPHTLRLFYDPPGSLRLTVGDRSYPSVKLYQAAPLSRPRRHISLLSGGGDEVAMIENVADFASDVQPVVETEIARRYLTARVSAVESVRTEFGVTYWRVATDRGERDFVVQSLSESCVWLSDKHLLLIDVDGNRFEITDRNGLDAQSQTLLDAVL